MSETFLHPIFALLAVTAITAALLAWAKRDLVAGAIAAHLLGYAVAVRERKAATEKWNRLIQSDLEISQIREGSAREK